MSTNTSTATLFKRIFFWLSGAGTETLEQCPNWEQRKYVAFGATVLVPSLFAFIACAYALSTLTDDWRVVVPVSLVWSFIILTIDRALLASYRPYQSFVRKIGQFGLRFAVAMLMGLTISHPLTLLLFRDTVTAEIEKGRQSEIDAARAQGEQQKGKVREAVSGVEKSVAEMREKWNATFNAEFLAERQKTEALTPDQAAAKAALDKASGEATGEQRANLAKVVKELETQETAARTLQGELDFWQKEFEREVNGQRSGIIGLGPRARSIQDDQLAWRREEAKRLATVLANLTSSRDRLRAGIASTEAGVAADFQAKAAAKEADARAEADRVEGLRRKVEAAQADQFVEQQNALRATIAKQIDTRLEELKRLQEELAGLTTTIDQRLAALLAEPRRDILTQTLALHALFQRGAQGGQFALTAYLVLALLFMLVDTIPLIVKFFTKAGPYDTLLDREEVRFDSEHKAFLAAHRRYMDQLAAGNLLALTSDKPLEKALIHGIERSKAASEFLNALLEMEQNFEERLQRERGRDRSQESVAALEAMATKFYADLRGRMEHFFEPGGHSREA